MVNIDPSNVDLLIKSQEHFAENEGCKTGTIMISGRIEKEELLFNEKIIPWFESFNENEKKKDDQNINAIKQLFNNKKISSEDFQKTQKLLMQKKIHFNLLYYDILGAMLHEIGHIKNSHSYINQFLDKARNNKLISHNLNDRWLRNIEYSAEILLALSFKGASSIMFKKYLFTLLANFSVDGAITSDVLNEGSNIHLTIQSCFILHADIAFLHGITIKKCLSECFKEINMGKNLFHPLYDRLIDIYQNADKDLLINNGSFNISRFLPDLMPTFLEKQFPEGFKHH